jgi:hypothetical protein
MKRALLWLGPLACMALACLYAYAWFTRDPLEDAFQRIQAGMTMAEAEAIMGRPADEIGVALGYQGATLTRVQFSVWNGDRRAFCVWPHEGRVDFTEIVSTEETILDKVWSWACNPSSLWAPPPVPVAATPVLALPVGGAVEDCEDEP